MNEVTEEEEKQKGFAVYVKKKAGQLRLWMQPDAADHWLLQGVKFIFKSIVLALMILFSPVLLAILLFVFFAAV